MIAVHKVTLCITIFFLLSCVTVTIPPASISNTTLSCNKLISKNVALVFQSQNSEQDGYLANKFLTETDAVSPFEKRFLNTRCFEKVKVLKSESLAKDFDRIIHIQLAEESRTTLAIAGSAVWLFASASTLFLLPYYQTDQHVVVLEDSRTMFKKTYELKSDSTFHLFYFFKDWNVFTTSSDITNAIFDDFFNELKAKK